VAAVDVGIVVNPDGVVNQIEGGCIQAVSWTLKEGMNARPLAWEDYPILKFSEVPRVEVVVLQSPQPSLGAGECTMGPVAAALGNAVHDALGVRVRDLPLTPERIVKAMG
jgi:CO/xanthine dehydrogenase Mo-binding subunit